MHGSMGGGWKRKRRVLAIYAPTRNRRDTLVDPAALPRQPPTLPTPPNTVSHSYGMHHESPCPELRPASKNGVRRHMSAVPAAGQMPPFAKAEPPESVLLDIPVV